MMLEVTRWLRPTGIFATTLTVAVCAGIASAGPALADHDGRSEAPVTLNGVWAPFNRCPVDDPRMLAATGANTIALCSTQNSVNGSMTIGNLTVTTKGGNHQFGIVENNEEGGAFTVIEPAAGGLIDEPVELPGGLRGLICPSSGHFVRHICRHPVGWDDRANALTWRVEQAGDLYNFNLLAGLQLEQPIGSQPVKIHLQNVLLGDDCYIGSDTEPIVLQAGNLIPPTGDFESFEGNGTPNLEGPLQKIEVKGVQGDKSFAVPAASGCGYMGFFDRVINEKIGLPSPAGKNSLLLNEASSALAGIGGLENVVPNDGKDLSKYWHSAVVSTPEEGDHHGFGGRPGGSGHWSDGHELEEDIRHGFRHSH